MAPAPKVTKVSAAQHAAGVAFAAAGRAAQAKTRAAAKKAGKPAPVSKAQHQAALKWAAAGRAAQKAKKTGKKPPKKAAVVLPKNGCLSFFGYDSTLPQPPWIAGGNDMLPTCASAAVANHLLAATGRRMSDADVLLLHALAGDDQGADLSGVLELLRSSVVPLSCGLVGLAELTQADEDAIAAGLLVGLSLPHARHAVLAHPRGMVSWGMVLPWQGVPDEAWAVQWLEQAC